MEAKPKSRSKHKEAQMGQGWGRAVKMPQGKTRQRKVHRDK